MIEIVCDACERPFEVDDEMAGAKVPCPMCRDINRVPESLAPAARPVPGGAAPVDGRANDGAERDLKVVRPAMIRAHPLRFLAILLLAGAGVAGWIWAAKIAAPWVAYAATLPFAFAVGWYIKWWIAAYLWIKIKITNKRTVKYEGIVRHHSTEVLHDHVRSVDINQGFWQRLFGVGYIGIDSAGQDGIEIEIFDIPRPDEIKKLIDAHRAM